MDQIKVPKNSDEALQDSRWRKAVEDELETLEKNQIWKIIDLLNGNKLVGCKLIFIIKYKASGIIERFKARLVANEYT